MSLLDKASLIVTPNAYKASKLYSVVPSSGAGDMTVVRATTATRVNSAGLIESVPVNVPRIDYTNGSCPSLLVEPQRTNLALNSDGNVSTYPGAINVTNASSSFNSFTNAIQFPNTALALAYKTIVTTAQTYTISVFIKMDDNSVPILSASQTTGNVSLVIAGAVVTNNLKVESLGNNIYRLSGTGASLGINNNNGVLRYDTQVLKSFKITGIQLEAASYPTSYIPTVASTVTRNADLISNNNLISKGLIVNDYVLFLDITNPILGNQYILDSTDISSLRTGILRVDGTTASITDITGGISLSILNILTIGKGKMCVKRTGSTLSFFANGVKALSTTTTTVGTINNLKTGVTNSTTPSYINSVVLFPTALTDTECINLTTL